MQLHSVNGCFIRRRGRGRSISLTCPECGYTQYDIQPRSRRGSEDVVDCARCGFIGPVTEISRRLRGKPCP